MTAAPSEGGSYALLLRVGNASPIRVGRLGLIDFPAGVYVYTGSALGPGGLRARLSHHLRRAAAPRWHIDWLRQEAEVEGYWWARGSRPWECIWTVELLRCLDARVPQKGFGSSDCTHGCPAHLLFFGKMKATFTWRARVEEIFAGLSGPVFYCGADYPAGSVYESAGA